MVLCLLSGCRDTGPAIEVGIQIDKSLAVKLDTPLSIQYFEL